MDLNVYIAKLIQLVIYPFSFAQNPIIFIPFCVFTALFTLGIVKKLAGRL